MMNLRSKNLIDWSVEDEKAKLFVTMSLLRENGTGVRMKYQGTNI